MNNELRSTAESYGVTEVSVNNGSISTIVVFTHNDRRYLVGIREIPVGKQLWEVEYRAHLVDGSINSTIANSTSTTKEGVLRNILQQLLSQ